VTASTSVIFIGPAAFAAARMAAGIAPIPAAASPGGSCGRGPNSRYPVISPARIQVMARALRADDILPLVDSLTPQERVRLLRLIARPQGGDAPVYRSVPPSRDEFSADDEPLAWDAEGWENVG